ncbi:MAG TPA: tetratricopeptide repeat protein [Longimicrobium sp.]|nr:tetratricopeptide repeat protein [Longimicrobium sp.]
MRTRRLTPPVRRATRRWRTPPAILHGREPFEGAAVLDEMQGPLGVLLFQVVRDVYLWGSTPPDQRTGLFPDHADEAMASLLRSADADVQLESALLSLVRMTGAPDRALDEQVALACQHVAHWADVNGHAATAIAFAQGAAVVLPADAAASYAVGRLARRRGEFPRAETWYRRAVALGRQSGDWTSYAMAFAGLGNLYMARGNFPAARRFSLKALRSARRHSMRALQALVLHDLFVIAAQTRRADEAEQLAREAFALYGPDHPRLVHLTSDVAAFWMEHGRFAPALTVFQALVHHLQRHEERVFALANMVRAAGGAGERQLFEQSWDEVWDRMARIQALGNAAVIMLQLARGAVMLGEYVRAERAAGLAMQTARERGEGKVLLEAEAVLDEARRSRAMHDRSAAPQPGPELSPGSESFAMDLVRTLNASLVAR